MGYAELLGYTLRGTGFPKLFWRLLSFPWNLTTSMRQGAWEWPLTPAARSGGLSLLLGWVTSSAKPSPSLELILKPSGLVLQTMALGHRSQTSSEFQRNKATTIRLEPTALDCVVSAVNPFRNITSSWSREHPWEPSPTVNRTHKEEGWQEWKKYLLNFQK